MKIQIKFQKILFLVTLIIAALTVVYGLAFCSGSLAYAFKVTSGKFSKPFNDNPINADALYSYVIGEEYICEILPDGKERWKWEHTLTGFNNVLVVMAIVLVVLAALQFFFANNNRRNYYITNYITVGVFAVYALVFAIVALAGISHALGLFNDINWDYYYEVYYIITTEGGSGWSQYSDSKLMFVLGYILFATVIINVVLLVLNTVWKVLLMKGEKALLGKAPVQTTEEVVL